MLILTAFNTLMTQKYWLNQMNKLISTKARDKDHISMAKIKGRDADLCALAF